MVSQYVNKILIRDLNQLKKELSAIDDRLLWSTQEGIINSCGTLARHICGNLRHFIGYQIGEIPYKRDIEDEFSGPPVDKSILLENIDQTIDTLTKVFRDLDEKKLNQKMPDPPPHHAGCTIGFFLIQLCCHFSRHWGQFNYLRRINEGSL
jgi:hypothetical protein